MPLRVIHHFPFYFVSAIDSSLNRGMKSQLLKSESGSATAEYAIATMAAVGFAGLLVVIMRSDEVKQILYDLVMKALTVGTP